jgi:hypothetical protein
MSTCMMQKHMLSASLFMEVDRKEVSFKHIKNTVAIATPSRPLLLLHQ